MRDALEILASGTLAALLIIWADGAYGFSAALSLFVALCVLFVLWRVWKEYLRMCEKMLEYYLEKRSERAGSPTLVSYNGAQIEKWRRKRDSAKRPWEVWRWRRR